MGMGMIGRMGMGLICLMGSFLGRRVGVGRCWYYSIVFSEIEVVFEVLGL